MQNMLFLSPHDVNDHKLSKNPESMLLLILIFSLGLVIIVVATKTFLVMVATFTIYQAANHS